MKGALMWIRFLLKPFWARVFTVACAYGVVKIVDWCARGLPAEPSQSPWSTLGWQVVGAMISGLVLAAFTDNSHNAFAGALYGLDSRQRSEAIDASFRGPVPADPKVRDAAVRVAQRRVYATQFCTSNYRALLVLIVLFTGLGLALGTWPSGWDRADWMWTAALVCAAVATWYVSASAKRRLQILT
jgi:hypothetical protein